MSAASARLPRVYLAGPDVFLPDAAAVGAQKRELCRRHGFEGLFPLDGEPDPSPGAAQIFRANCALLRSADAGLFNLTPFRGPGADAGTVFELGFLFARGVPVHGYSSCPGAYLERVRQSHGPLELRGGSHWDPDGLAVEDFGLADNLMISEAIAQTGGRFCALAQAGPGALAALHAFEALLAALAADRCAAR